MSSTRTNIKNESCDNVHKHAAEEHKYITRTLIGTGSESTHPGPYLTNSCETFHLLARNLISVSFEVGDAPPVVMEDRRLGPRTLDLETS